MGRRLSLTLTEPHPEVGLSSRYPVRVTPEDTHRDQPDDAPQGPGPARRSPFDVASLVPRNLLDRGRAVRDHLDDTRATLDAATTKVRDTKNKLRAPGGLLGPPRPATNIPQAPTHSPHRTRTEVATLLPRTLDVPVPRADGVVESLGWTGDLFPVGESARHAIIRRLPRPPAPVKAAFELLDELITDTSSADTERRVVELLDPDGHVLLRSAPTWRRRPDGGRTARTVMLGDGTPVADVVHAHRKARSREILLLGARSAVTASIDLHDLYPGGIGTARIWRGSHELAATHAHSQARLLTHDHTRTLALDTTTDDDTLLTWAAALCWWGGPGL